jgi:hypothetical protein
MVELIKQLEEEDEQWLAAAIAGGSDSTPTLDFDAASNGDARSASAGNEQFDFRSRFGTRAGIKGGTAGAAWRKTL